MVDFLKEARKIEPEIIKTRREIHQRPELAYKEKATAKLVAERLRGLGIEVRTGVGGTGVLGILRGPVTGRVVALRADMDALPIEEMADIDFRSKENGVMHACGHDTHVAMLLGTAKLLANHKDKLVGTVKFLFQPAEEHGGRGGAEPMIQDGVMENPKVDFVFGLHIDGDENSGVLAFRGGPVMAAPDTFEIKIIGRGGHGAYPHQTVDPIYVAAQLIIAIQGISGRMIDPVQPFVITVGSIHSGTKENIIPDQAVLQGTIRTLDEATRKRAKAKVAKVARGVSRAFGARAEVEFEKDAYPVTVNDEKVTEEAKKILSKMPGTRVKIKALQLGGEDFSSQGTPAWRRGFLQIPPRSPGNILLPWNQKPGQGLHLSKPQPEIQSGRGCSQVRNRVARAISNRVHEPEELEQNLETKPFSSVTSFPRSSLNQWLERSE